MFKATKIKFKNQNAMLKIIFSLQEFTLLKKINCLLPPTKPISFVTQSST